MHGERKIEKEDVKWEEAENDEKGKGKGKRDVRERERESFRDAFRKIVDWF